MSHAVGPENMKMIELALDQVHIDPLFRCRARSYTAEEIEEARATFEVQPMLSPPAVAQHDGRWTIVCGAMRFEVLKAMGLERALFRLVEGNAVELLLIALADELVRREPSAAEIAQRLTMLRDLGVKPWILARYCRRSERWVRELTTLQRDAHPELWTAFCEGAPHLTLRRMIDLVNHEPAEQLERWRAVEAAAECADTHARGYAEEVEPEPLPDGTPHRRRFPPRRYVQQVFRLVQEEPSLSSAYREGALDILRWLLFQTDLDVKLSLATFAKLERVNAPAADPNETAQQDEATPDEEDEDSESVTVSSELAALVRKPARR